MMIDVVVEFVESCGWSVVQVFDVKRFTCFDEHYVQVLTSIHVQVGEGKCWVHVLDDGVMVGGFRLRDCGVRVDYNDPLLFDKLKLLVGDYCV